MIDQQQKKKTKQNYLGKMMAIAFAVIVLGGFASPKARAATCSCSANSAGVLMLNNLWRSAWDPVGSQVDLPTSQACEQECADRGAKSYRSGIGVFHNVSLVSTAVKNASNAQNGVNPVTGNISANDRIPGTTASGGLVQCGRGGQRMCTLCDIVIGLNVIIKYIFRIAIVVGIFGFAIGGVMYILSRGDSGAATNAKNVMTNTVIGLVVILSAWLVINYSMILLGTKSNLGLKINGWGNFECTASPR